MNIDYTTLLLDVTEFDAHYAESGRNSRFGFPMQAYSREAFLMFVTVKDTEHSDTTVFTHVGEFSEKKLEGLLEKWSQEQDLKECTIDFGLLVAPDNHWVSYTTFIDSKIKAGKDVTQYRIQYLPSDDKWAFSRTTSPRVFPLSICYEDIGLNTPPCRIAHFELSFLSVIFLNAANMLRPYRDTEALILGDDINPRIEVKAMFEDGELSCRTINLGEKDGYLLANHGQEYRKMINEVCNNMRAGRVEGKSSYCIYTLTFLSKPTNATARKIQFYVKDMGHTVVFRDTCPDVNTFLNEWLGLDIPDSSELIAFKLGERCFIGKAYITGAANIEITSYEEITADEYHKRVDNNAE